MSIANSASCRVSSVFEIEDRLKLNSNAFFSTAAFLAVTTVFYLGA